MAMMKYMVALVLVQVSMPSAFASRSGLPLHLRYRRELSKSTDVAGGTGTASISLPETGGLVGKLAYERNLMDNEHGRVDAFADATHISGLDPSVSKFGGAVKWSNDNAFAKLDVDHTKHGSTQLDALAGGKWNPARDTELTAGAKLSQTLGGGRPDFGFMAHFIHRFR